MFPWLIWLCMAGTAKGTVPSPLSSGAYIRLTGTSHFHRYYGAIRLPTTLLFPSFRCVHIPRFTRFRGRCRLSPVDKIALYSMDRSQTPPWHPQARPYRPFLCCLPRFPLGRPTVLLSFDCSILFLLPPSPRFTYVVTAVCAGSVLAVGLLLIQAGFPPACYLALCWAHGKFE